MKSFLIAMSLIASTAVMAKPATTAFQSVLPAGTYSGRACTVVVNVTDSAVGVSIQTNNSSDSFVVANSSKNVSITKTEVKATQSLSFPHYVNGGTKILNVKVNEENESIAVAITNILLDHRGNDASTYTECLINL